MNTIQISNTNFKGFYQPRNISFSDSQNRVIDDMKQTLGKDIISKNDFMVFPGVIANTVELVHYVTGLKTQGTGINERVVYHKGSDKLIGVYDEKHPFKLEDLNSSGYWSEENSSKSDNTWKYIAGTIIALGALLIGNSAVKKIFGNQNKPMIEKVIPTTKDSLNTIKKDSLNLFM